VPMVDAARARPSGGFIASVMYVVAVIVIIGLNFLPEFPDASSLGWQGNIGARIPSDGTVFYIKYPSCVASVPYKGSPMADTLYIPDKRRFAANKSLPCAMANC